MTYTVNCHVPDNADSDRRMQGIGGPGWYKTVDQVLSAIDSGDSFTVTVGGKTVKVTPGKHASGKRYITTEGDGFPPNNLLKLSRCPGR